MDNEQLDNIEQFTDDEGNIVLEVFEDKGDPGFLFAHLPDADNYDTAGLDIQDVFRLRDILNEFIERDGRYDG